MDRKEELFTHLVKKTKELGHELKYEEVRKLYEAGEFITHPNNFAVYYGGFTNAAHEAYYFCMHENDEEEKQKPIVLVKGVYDDMSKKFKRKPLDPERREAVLSELVDMYIENNGQMPSSRQIKRNRYIFEDEVDFLRRTGDYTEKKIRRRAEERTGRSFSNEKEKVVSVTPKEEACEVAVSEPEKPVEAELPAETEPEAKPEEEAPMEPEELVEAESEVLSEPEPEPEPEPEEPEPEPEPEEPEPEPEEPEPEELEPEPKEEQRSKNSKCLNRYTTEECMKMFGDACRAAKRVLTQGEVNSLSLEGKMPTWSTLKKRIGPWYNWSEMFGVPYANKSSAMAAEAAQKKDLEKMLEAENAKEAEENTEEVSEEAEDVIEEPEEEDVDESDVDESEEEFEGESEDDTPVDDSEEPEDDTPADADDDVFDLDSIYVPSTSDEADTIVLPIKVVLPKVRGVKGTVNITIEF